MIRYLTAQDFAVYKSIRVEALTCDPDAFGETLDAVRHRTDQQWADWLSRAIVPERKGIVCVMDDGRAVGTCGFGLSESAVNTGFFWGMFVSLSMRRRGYGQLLLDTAETWIWERGGNVMTARVSVTNQAAISFYRRTGYTIGDPSGTLREGSEIRSCDIRKELEPRANGVRTKGADI